MTLGLTLSDSRLKLARATEHAYSLNRETTFAVSKTGPYPGRLGEPDQEMNFPVVIRKNPIPESTQERLSVIIGDTFHNLRSALDYIVSALVTASDIEIETFHQFPIFHDPDDYAKKIWRKGEQVGRGWLRGVKHGLAEIEALQPYHRQPEPDHDPLWLLNRFSNHDKHRRVADCIHLPNMSGPFSIQPSNQDYEPVWFQLNLGPLGWDDHDEMQVCTLRFREPPVEPSQFALECHLAITTNFLMHPQKGEKRTWAISTGMVDGICEQVGGVVDLFERL